MAALKEERSVIIGWAREEPKEKAGPHMGEGRVFGAACDGMRLSLSPAQLRVK